MQKPSARIKSQTSGDKVDNHELRLGPSGGYINDDIFSPACNYIVDDVGDKKVMPVHAKGDALTFFEKVLSEK